MNLFALLFAVVPLDVPAGQSLTIDEPAEYASVDVYGELTVLADIASHGNITVHEGGSLIIENAFLNFVVEDDRRMKGGDLSPENRGDDVGLWIEGSCSITGEEKTPWVELTLGTFEDHSYGLTKALCSKPAVTPLNWLEGDSYVLIGPSGVVMDQAIVGMDSVYAIRAGKTIIPRAVNLTRTAGVRGGEGNHKAHVIVLENGELNARFAEFRNLGPTGKLGRYPVHLHHSLHRSAIEDCSIRESGNRGIAIHDSAGHVLSRNVLFNILGHGIFLEDPKGNEVDNTIVGNITINVSGNATGDEVIPTPEDATYRKTAHYWLRPGNTIRDNLAVGGTALGCVIMPGKGGTSANAENQQAWGCGQWGLQNGVPTTWVEPVAINCAVAGYASMAKWGLDDTGTKIVDPCFLLNGQKTDEKTKSYRSQAFFNNSAKTKICGGVLAGEVGLAVHYASDIEVNSSLVDCETLCSMTYYECPVKINGGEVKAKFLTDWPYSPRITSHGSLQLKAKFNGANVDKTIVSSQIAQTAGIVPIDYVKDSFGRIVASEIPRQTPGYFTLPPDVKFVRLWNPGAAKPTTWPIFYSRGFTAGLLPGKYFVELMRDEKTSLRVVEVAIESGKTTEVK